jgi:DNA polymerase-4/DNA polymerase V
MPHGKLIRSFPRAILHVDGDSFFASCEIAKDPSLRGKVVVTGQERGIASSMSYEAKRRGITRAMNLHEIRRMCPDAVILPSDYETYSLYSERMYEIVRRYTEAVEEYSIDECFADLTGMRRPNNMSYPEMAERVKRELQAELGMTFSVGLSVNKVTAKMASKFRKPDGLTIASGRDLHLYLAKVPIDRIWGIGPNTSAYLQKLGIGTALDFAEKPEGWVKEHLSKPFYETWQELNGESVMPLAVGEKHDYASIQKTRTFTPPSRDRDFVYSQLSKNVENACIKLRRHTLFTTRISFFLKTQDFRYRGLEVKLSRAVSTPEEILSVIRDRFDRLYRPADLYRATGITLGELAHVRAETLDLFGAAPLLARAEEIHEAIDRLDERYGKHTVFLGSSWKAMRAAQHEGDRGVQSARRQNVVRGETARKHINLPFLGKVA